MVSAAAKQKMRNQRLTASTDRHKNKSSRMGLLKRTVLFGLYLNLLGVIGAFGFLYYLSTKLPPLDEMVNPVYDLPTQVFDRDGNLIKEFYTKHRVLIRFEQVPKVMVQALLAIEDSRFYDHIGIDPLRLLGALAIDIKEGRFAQGGSTLTMQTAKNFLLTPDKKIIRKLKELLLALKIENRFTKNQILELYLNKAPYGHGAYGIEAAAQGYFGKTTGELKLVEAALLAGLPQAPSRLAPTSNIELATRRRNLVLRKMNEIGYITTEERIRAQLTPIELRLNPEIDSNETAYYMEHVRRYLHDQYGQDLLYRGGMKVYTAMDLHKQVAAQKALRDGLIAHDRRQGYRGTETNLLSDVDNDLGLFIFTEIGGWDTEAFKALPDQTQLLAKELFHTKISKITEDNHFIIGGTVNGVVTDLNQDKAEVTLGAFQGNLWLEDMTWARPVDYRQRLDWRNRLRDLRDILKVGDVIELEIADYDNEAHAFILSLSQKPLANGAVFSMNPESGHVLAMSGGFDFRDSEFNRAIQGKRQTGSAFKPIVYALALDNSFTTASMLDDTPFVAGGIGGERWKPDNYSGRFTGKVSLRSALVDSKNLPSIRLINELGTDLVIDHARKLGITGDLPANDPTIVLGTASLTLEEMVKAYATFANGGKLVKPVFITRVVDRDGNTLEEHAALADRPVISPETAFLMTSMLEDVVNSGTGRRAQAINRPSAGKTGTTDNYTDAWYIGYIPQVITGVYVGFDQSRQPLGDNEQGALTALPVWVDYMEEATAAMPILPFRQPDGINIVRIHPDSGLLACEIGNRDVFEFFKVGTEPVQCHRQNEYLPSVPATPDTLTRRSRQRSELIEEL
jgi:penicillin-binding protein 1A